ncbi:hypothetical protein [Deinococcus pimensis]|uniref:hypothetical protein n=1 Tax=Deinococcus pimensis TaxID=309888 RepID=UPI00069353B4|nr:hypothetical protein [Deinococcus pimensis]
MTLVELLLAGALGLLVLAAISLFIRNGTNAAESVEAQRRLLEDTRAAGNYLSDVLASAAYVYPPGLTLTLSAPSAYAVRNPATGKGTWTIGTHPVVAALLLPRDPTRTCDTSRTPEGCVRFVAFYALSRAHVEANAPAEVNPGPGPSDARALYVLRAALNMSRVPESAPLTVTASEDASLLIDNLDDPGMETTSRACTEFGRLRVGGLLVTCPAAAVSSATNSSVSLLGVRLRPRVKDARRDVSATLDFSVAPRNLVLF